VPHLHRRADFQRHIISPLLTGQPDCTLNLRLLLDAVCLRRLMSLMKLPQTQYQTQMVELSAEERSLYENILQSSMQDIDTMISSKSSGKAYSSILRAILRTRMLCDHGTFQQKKSKSRLTTPSMDDESTLASLQEGDEGRNSNDSKARNYFSANTKIQKNSFLRNLQQPTIHLKWKLTFDITQVKIYCYQIQPLIDLHTQRNYPRYYTTLVMMH